MLSAWFLHWQSLGRLHPHMLLQLFMRHCMEIDFVTAVGPVDLWIHFTSLGVHGHRPYAIIAFYISNFFGWWMPRAKHLQASTETHNLLLAVETAVVISSSEHGWQESWIHGFVPYCFSGCVLFSAQDKGGIAGTSTYTSFPSRSLWLTGETEAAGNPLCI